MNLAGHSLKLIHSPNPRVNYSLYPKITYPSNREIILPKNNLLDVELLEIFNNRKSRRYFSSPLNIKQISLLLWNTLKITKIEVDESGTVVWNHCNVPSAGGLASIDTFIINISGEDRKLFYYNPYKHTLNELEINNNYIDLILEHSQNVIDSTNATQFIFGAQIKNLYSKYENAESLLWRDVGAIYMAIGLMSEACNFNSCSLGITYEPVLAKSLKQKGTIVGVGGIIVGTK